MLDFIRKISRYSDITLASGIIVILLVLLLPVPTYLLDVLLSFSVSLSVVILMATLLIKEPLELNVFPSMLLITTILRLSLNIASTRLILSEGDKGISAAGHVIEAFGQFVMQGNVVIGIIVFLILTLINFIVITKGSGRIAEVAARFSLDSMPGKQMAIDADLSAGLINEKKAKERRKKLEDESTFYGAMDGANKFVRGDAIAGLIITFINLVGGMIVAVLQKGMTFDNAITTYSVLTIGDGLVSQIPSLIISLSAGLLVTKSGVIGSTDKAIFGQLSNSPRALMMSAIVTALMAFLPGLPFLPFFTIACAIGGFAYLCHSVVPKKEIVGVDNAVEEDTQHEQKAEKVSEVLQLDIISIELGLHLISLVKGDNGMLTNQIKVLRKQMAKDLGFVVPSIRLQDNLSIDNDSYIINIKELESAKGSIQIDKLLVMDPKGDKIDIPGQDTTEPTFGLAAKWIEESYKDEALYNDYTVVDGATVIMTHLTEVIRENISELLSYTETQKLLDNLSEEYSKLVKDLVPEIIPVSVLQKVLQMLLSEMVSIRDLPAILEALGDASKISKTPAEMLVVVRNKLSRQICSMYADLKTNTISGISISPQWEQLFTNHLYSDGSSYRLSLPLSKLQEFTKEVKTLIDKHSISINNLVIFTSPLLRLHVVLLLERFNPKVPVLSHSEINNKFSVQNLGIVGG